jgi:Family of unknown function (DUF5715)
MRSCLLQFEGRSCLVGRVVLAFCLVAALLVTPFASASSTHATLGTRPHSKSPRLSHSRNSRRQAELHRLEGGHQRRAQYHRRSKTYARNHRLSVTLDQVHAHAATVADTVPPPTAPLPLLATPTATEQTADAVNTLNSREMPLFNTSVPSYMPVALRGSHEVLVHQNIIADVEGLGRIQDDAQLIAMVRSGDLVALPASPGLAIDPRLPLNRRYCRPWTAQFLGNLARAHQDIFGRPLQLTSAVRTVSFQRHLAHYNGNAAPTSGDTASPHLTGEAIDLGKKGMSLKEIAWMRAVLGELQASGKLDVEEEFEQACFHISVYKTYQPHSDAPAQLVASNDAPSEPVAAPAPAVVEPVGLPVKHSVHSDRAHSYYVHHVRRATYVHHRRHHRSMSLLAAGLR